ncbi:MAG: beta-eliminating lyase-related protein [Gemmatimonadales bacterium]
MRRAMAEAEVGDDVLDGDPTTRRLEQRVAELLGSDDALFFPSGTQANQAGIAPAHPPGDRAAARSERAPRALRAGGSSRELGRPDPADRHARRLAERRARALRRSRGVAPRSAVRARWPWRTPTTRRAGRSWRLR